MKPSLSIIREYILNLIRDSSLVAKLYTNLVLSYCNMVKMKLNSYDVLTLLCDAQRRVPDIDITKKCSELTGLIIQEKSCTGGMLLPIEQNQLLDAFYKSRRFQRARQVFGDEPEQDRLRLRHFRENSIPQRQGNMIILKKPDLETGEKGVIVLNYSPTFEHFVAVFNIRSLSKEFRIVFEPSSYRNIESSLFLYSGFGLTHVLQAAQNDDKIVLEKLISSIKIIDLGSGDWTDIHSFSPIASEKVYDVVMVASWLRLKRHEVLFKSLRELKNRGKNLRVALIGYPMDMKKEDIVRIAKKYGVDTFCDIYEQIPPPEVARIVSSAKVALHLSKYEGTNRASYEALLCNVPLIVYKHNVGFRNNYINEYTGLFADDNELADAMEYVFANEDVFSPREWILQCSGHINSTHKLNEALKEIALEMGEPWTIDIVTKKNGPNFLYAHEEDRIAMKNSYYKLRKHLII